MAFEARKERENSCADTGQNRISSQFLRPKLCDHLKCIDLKIFLKEEVLYNKTSFCAFLSFFKKKKFRIKNDVAKSVIDQ